MACRAVVALADVVDLLQAVPLDIGKPKQLNVAKAIFGAPHSRWMEVVPPSKVSLDG